MIGDVDLERDSELAKPEIDEEKNERNRKGAQQDGRVSSDLDNWNHM